MQEAGSTLSLRRVNRSRTDDLGQVWCWKDNGGGWYIVGIVDGCKERLEQRTKLVFTGTTDLTS